LGQKDCRVKRINFKKSCGSYIKAPSLG